MLMRNWLTGADGPGTYLQLEHAAFIREIGL